MSAIPFAVCCPLTRRWRRRNVRLGSVAQGTLEAADRGGGSEGRVSATGLWASPPRGKAGADASGVLRGDRELRGQTIRIRVGSEIRTVCTNDQIRRGRQYVAYHLARKGYSCAEPGCGELIPTGTLYCRVKAANRNWPSTLGTGTFCLAHSPFPVLDVYGGSNDDLMESAGLETFVEQARKTMNFLDGLLLVLGSAEELNNSLAEMEETAIALGILERPDYSKAMRDRLLALREEREEIRQRARQAMSKQDHAEMTVVARDARDVLSKLELLHMERDEFVKDITAQVRQLRP